ncbi:MAG: DUF2442 domain-containing protein [Candidatus Hydrogenedens sp.]|nr:DUF2442 domain-containing protein [Candidatus Hydrogenedens sp.]
MTSPKLIAATHESGYKIHVVFADGVEGTIDLESELWGEVFEPLREAERFREFRLDMELNTIVWPTGADFAPEFLHERALSKAEVARP